MAQNILKNRYTEIVIHSIDEIDKSLNELWPKKRTDNNIIKRITKDWKD